MVQITFSLDNKWLEHPEQTLGKRTLIRFSNMEIDILKIKIRKSSH
jgi:hypothetical protein